MTHFADLMRKAGETAGEGALWGFETQDLDCTLVAWEKGKGVATHTNNELDVIMLVTEGRVLVELENKDQQVAAGQMLILRKGTTRRIEALSERVVYLNIHKRRRALQLGDIGTFRESSGRM